MKISLWKVDVIGATDRRHYLVAAPDAYTAKTLGRTAAQGDGVPANNRATEVYVTLAYAFPAGTVSVGYKFAETMAREAGVNLEHHRPRLDPARLVDVVAQQELAATCACGEPRSSDSHDRCRLIGVYA